MNNHSIRPLRLKALLDPHLVRVPTTKRRSTLNFQSTIRIRQYPRNAMTTTLTITNTTTPNTNMNTGNSRNIIIKL